MPLHLIQAPSSFVNFLHSIASAHSIHFRETDAPASKSAFCLFIFFLIATSQQAQAASCVLYEHSNFTGSSVMVPPNMTHELGQFNMNDRASALVVPPTCQLIVYEHPNSKGNARVYDHNTSLAGDYFNDRVSSARCECAGIGCIMYQHPNYQGQELAMFLNDDFNNLAYPAPNRNTGLLISGFDNQLSSVRILANCWLATWDYAASQGEVRNFHADTPYLGDAWNDRVSSARCVCN